MSCPDQSPSTITGIIARPAPGTRAAPQRTAPVDDLHALDQRRQVIEAAARRS